MADSSLAAFSFSSFYSTGEPGPRLRKYVVGNFKVE